jgi:hypothetical protein
LKIVASYSSGILRFYDLAESTFLGKNRSLSKENYRIINFLPDGKFVFLVDNLGIFYLMSIEKWNPLQIQIHQKLSRLSY